MASRIQALYLGSYSIHTYGANVVSKTCNTLARESLYIAGDTWRLSVEDLAHLIPLSLIQALSVWYEPRTKQRDFDMYGEQDQECFSKDILHLPTVASLS